MPLMQYQSSCLHDNVQVIALFIKAESDLEKGIILF